MKGGKTHEKARGKEKKSAGSRTTPKMYEKEELSPENLWRPANAVSLRWLCVSYRRVCLTSLFAVVEHSSSANPARTRKQINREHVAQWLSVSS